MRTSELAAPIIQLEGHGAEVFTCKFSPDGDLFASAGHDKSIFLWRPLHPDCENFAVLRGHKSAVLELHWCPDGDRIVTASPDKTARLWDVSYGIQTKKMAEHTDVVNSCHPLRRGAPLVVTGSEDSSIRVCNYSSKSDNFQRALSGAKCMSQDHSGVQIALRHRCNRADMALALHCSCSSSQYSWLNAISMGMQALCCRCGIYGASAACRRCKIVFSF